MRCRGRSGAGLSGIVFVALSLLLACGETKPSRSGAHAGEDAGGGTGAQAGGKASGGSTASGGAAFDGDQSNPDELLEAQGRVYCARLFRCFENRDDFMASRLILKTPAGCEAKVRELYEQEPGRRDLQAQLTAGLLHYDHEAAARCVAELSTCNGTDSFTEGSCREVFDGSAQTGEACQRSEDCAGDAYCQLTGSTCPGQCRPRKASGEACELNRECAYSTGVAFCDRGNAATGECRTLAPGAKAGLEEPCTRLLRGSSALILCEDELWCGVDSTLGADAAQGRCIAPLQIGDPCSDGDDVCLGGLCDVASGVCRQAKLRSKPGESCSRTMLIGCDPTLGLRCSGDEGTCLGSGDGSEGSDCFGGDFQRGCAAGLYCAPGPTPPMGTCSPRLATGAPCEQGSACESGNCQGTCQARYCGY